MRFSHSHFNGIYKALFSACLLITSQLSIGQSQYTSAADSDPIAMELLEHISSHYQSKQAHKIKFSLDIELPAQGMETQNGTLIQKDDQFVLEMQGRTIISNGETVWMYLEDMNEVQVNDADFEEASEFTSPSDIFNLHTSGEYVFAIANSSKEDGQAVTQIEGKPLSEESDYSKMRLTVIDQGKQVKRLKIFSKDGSRFTMHINEHDADYVPGAGTFTFDASKYEGVHVEDLRF